MPSSANPVTTSQWPGLTVTWGRTFWERRPGVLMDDRNPISHLLRSARFLGAGFSGDNSARIKVMAEEGALRSWGPSRSSRWAVELAGGAQMVMSAGSGRCQKGLWEGVW